MAERLGRIARWWVGRVFHKILIANRGEIALRILRACRELGIRAVVAHSKVDAHSLPVRLADESICIGPDDARSSYLNIPSIISAAAVTDSDAIHPGYGFLSENPAFAEICRACGIVFIGPSPEAIRLMGDKAQAREIARQAGAPIIPGSEGSLKDDDQVLSLAETIGFPVMLKAASGGGGRGMRIVRDRDALAQAFATCQAEAAAAFGSSEVYLEKFLDQARHIEVQVLGDRAGTRRPGTSRSRCSGTGPGPGSISGSATARSSAGTRNSWRNPQPQRSRRKPAPASRGRPWPWRRPSTTRAPARWSFWWTGKEASTSSR